MSTRQPQTASGDQRHTDVLVCAALQNDSTAFQRKKHNTIRWECLAVIKACRSYRSDRDFLLLSQQLCLMGLVYVHTVTLSGKE